MFHSPFFYRFPYYNTYFNRPPCNIIPPNSHSPNDNKKDNIQNVNKGNNCDRSNKCDPKSYPKSDSINISNEATSSTHNISSLEIFGLKLNSDDILLIAIIFFLYIEGVKDEELFIILILLLLS